jgi:hypothetical protein
VPIRRMNFTSRKRLTREHANVVIHPAPDPTGPATFDVELDLTPLRPAADAARIFVEAYHQTTRMRFDFGTVAAPVKPPPPQRRLHEFPDWRDVRFRVKVTDVDGTHGRIVAWADRIKPKGPEDQDEPDLVRFRDADLDGLLWDIEFDDDGPVVLVERKAGGAQRIGRDDAFIAAVYPEVLRRSLDEALLVQQAVHDDPQHWLKEWHDGYLKAKLGLRKPPPPDQEAARREWIREAVGAFSRRFQIVQHWPTDDSQQPGGTT